MFDFKIGEEYAWISPPNSITRTRRIYFFKIADIRKYEYYPDEIMFIGHPYHRESEYHGKLSVIKSFAFDLKYDAKIIKIENEQHKLALKLKYA